MVPHIQDQLDLPPELCAKPLALIGLTGLDTVNNAVQKSIWDAFNNNRRAERAPVTFKLLSNAHEFPVIKPKRNSYEWYIPKGILKRNWMNKHLNEIPAVIVIFYDLDWNNPQWNERMIECSSRVQSMRAALEGRNTRITVVLIQQTLPLPTGEDALASERAAALCASCELNQKSLFILPLGDHLQGYTVRLETAFYDLAQNYYHQEARNIKLHRDHLNKTTHQYLFVRHQFKMGFLNELKQENHTAHKHYVHAYNNLLELRIVDTNALEIKTIAGFINYKLCRLMFVLNLPRDAISQFRAHVDRFKSRIGFRELAFEHQAWLSKQFNVFGDIFDEAVKLGLPAVQTQHPGFYYQQAAQYATARKQSSLELCQDITDYPSPDPLDGIENLEFYGQRPWRPGKLSADPPDPQKEQNGIQALQYLEKQVNHSNIIISYYGLAISQFKTYRCPRMRRHLVVQMADEYYKSNDYGKALTLLTHMLWDYRSEKWWHLISDILRKALYCAYLSGNIQDFISLSLEVLTGCTTIAEDEKTRVFQNLTKVLQKEVPDADINLPESELIKADSLWRNNISAEPLTVSIEMNNILSCIDSKARFTQPKYEVDQNVTIEIFIRNTSSHTLNFSNLSVTVNTPNYSSEFAVSEGQVNDGNFNPTLSFEPNQIKRFLVECLPDVQDIGQDIQIGSIILHLGQKTERCAILRFAGTGTNNRNHSELLHFRSKPPDNMPDFDNIKSLGSAQIIPRLSKVIVNVEHEQPALVGEWYLIKLSVTNAELNAVRNLQAKVTLDIDEVGSELAKFTTDPSGQADSLPLLLQLNDLKVNEMATINFYTKSHRTGDRNITIRISYLFDVDRPIESIKEEVINIPVTKPFEITTKFFSKRFETISKFYLDEVFVVMPQVKCISPWPIIIENTCIEFNSLVRAVDLNTKSQLVNVELKKEELGAEVFAAGVDDISEDPIDVGFYTVHWRRIGTDILNTTKVEIKGLSVDETCLRVQTIIPAHGFVRTPMMITYELHNRSLHLIQLDMIMDPSEAFMFSGYKQVEVTILPKCTKILKYNLYPLVPGNVALPKLRLYINEKNLETTSVRQTEVTELLDRCVPTHLYIMPQVKGNPLSSTVTEITSTVVQS